MAKTITEIRNDYMKELVAYLSIPELKRPPMSQKLLIKQEGFRIIDSVNATSSMFEYLKARSMVKYGNYSEEKDRVVRETVHELQARRRMPLNLGCFLVRFRVVKQIPL